MSEVSTMKSKTVTFSYRLPKKVKNEEQVEEINGKNEMSSDEMPKIKIEDENDENEKNGIEYVSIDLDYYSKLDKAQYPFSSKYIPKRLKEPQDQEHSPIINKTSLLLHNMEDYKTVNDQNEYKWGDESNQVVESLRIWRRLYKILDHKKRQLKKASTSSSSSSSQNSIINSMKDPFHEDGGSSTTSNGEGPSNGNNSSNDSSSNGMEESEDVSSDNTTKISSSKRNKRRKLSGNRASTDGIELIEESDTLESRKTRSTRSSR